LHIKQTELFVEAKTAEQECLTEMPNVSRAFNGTETKLQILNADVG
jgi:hypothetical protein